MIVRIKIRKAGPTSWTSGRNLVKTLNGLSFLFHIVEINYKAPQRNSYINCSIKKSPYKRRYIIFFNAFLFKVLCVFLFLLQDILPIQTSSKCHRNVSIRSSNRSFSGLEKRKVYSSYWDCCDIVIQNIWKGHWTPPGYRFYPQRLEPQSATLSPQFPEGRRC